MTAVVATVLVTLLAAPAARAQGETETVDDLSQPGDYEVDHDGWNGLSTLAAIAAGSGLEVSTRTNIDWEELDSDDLLLLIYPTNFVDPGNLLTFIRNGGRVLIADDFGASGYALSRLGSRLSAEAVRADRYHDSQTFAPIAYPVDAHPLSGGIAELTTNHPAALRNLEGLESVFEFDDGGTLVAAGEIGMGRFVLLADPSVLINRMLQFEGNLQFAINVIRFLARPGESDRIVVLAGDVSFRGRPRNLYDDGTFRGKFGVLVTAFDNWLDELNDYLLTATSLKVVSVVLAIFVAILAFLALPSRRRSPLDGRWTRAGTPGLRGFEDLVKHYDSDRRLSYLLPAAILRDNVNSALEMALGTPDPLFSLGEDALLAAVGERYGRESAGDLTVLLPQLRSLPQRAQAASPWQARFLARREFELLHGKAERLLRSLNPNRN